MTSKSYDELHGSDNWDGLLDPLHHDLRSLVLGYGDLAFAAQQAFNVDKGSKYAGYSRYGKSSFFKGVMLPWADSKYDVTSFIYATVIIDLNLPLLPNDVTLESSWMGYVTVSNDEFSTSIGRREICVVWRGSEGDIQLKDDIIYVAPVPAYPLFPTTGPATDDTPKVMDGWLRIYNSADPDSKFLKTSARTQLLGKIGELLVKYKNEKVSIMCTGHSLGGSLAVLSAVDLAANVATSDTIVSTFVFSCPQVGNEAFKSKMEELPNLKVLSVKHEQDIVPMWPSKILKYVDDNTWVTVPSNWLEYVDVGIQIVVNGKKSPYLKDESNPVAYHDLQGVLHTLGGWNGENGDFDWSLSKRDISLVNMKSELLKDELQIPGYWWVEKNKGMVIDDDGHWVLSPIDLDDHDL